MECRGDEERRGTGMKMCYTDCAEAKCPGRFVFPYTCPSQSNIVSKALLTRGHTSRLRFSNDGHRVRSALHQCQPITEKRRLRFAILINGMALTDFALSATKRNGEKQPSARCATQIDICMLGVFVEIVMRLKREKKIQKKKMSDNVCGAKNILIRLLRFSVVSG